jgi:Spy/CpxP family protein refolding chaperone
MRRKIAIGVLSLMVLVGAAFVVSAEDGAPQGPGSGQGQHEWSEGQHRFAQGGQFGGERRMGGPGAHRMGWERGGRGGFGHGGGLLRMAENPRVRQYLGLTDEQVSRLHQIGLNERKAAVQNRADMELRRIEFGELMRADSPDHDAIMQKLDEMNALRGKMEKARVETLLSARAVLTPDQLKKVKTFMENRGEGMERGPMMQHRGGPGGWTARHPGNPPGGANPKPTPTPPPTQ